MSALAERADEYVRLRRAFGYKLDEAARLLPRLVAHLDDSGAETLTIEAALAWAQEPDAGPDSTVWARRMTVARGFARYLSGIDPRAEVPPVGLVPWRKRRRTPYSYSWADVAALMAAARSIPTPLRAATYETLIGLLVVTGMRVGEAIRLDRTDVDWRGGVLLVRESKFRKSREIPLHASSVDALAAYASRRDGLQPHPQAPVFFISTVGTRLIYGNVHHTFRGLVSAARVGERSAIRPRIHDIRHGFAEHTLVGWYRDGEDVEVRLPSLSTYLGHREPRFTYRYLSAIPELLGLAAERLEAARRAQP